MLQTLGLFVITRKRFCGNECVNSEGPVLRDDDVVSVLSTSRRATLRSSIAACVRGGHTKSPVPPTRIHTPKEHGIW